MRDVYPEYFERSSEEIQRFVLKSTVVLDANVLLSLYRLSADARDDALAILEAPAVSDRLWIPYQVGKEFLENRPGVIASLGEAYKTARQALDDAAKKSVAAFGDGRRFEASRASVRKAIDEAHNALMRKLDSIAATDPARVDLEADPLLDRIGVLTAGKIGTRPSDDVLRARIETFFNFRAPMLVPPGYRDANAKKGACGAGDYLLWCELLDHAAEVVTPILFVTEDRKDDWVERSHGQTSGPRRELVAEFAQRSPHGYHQVTFDLFLQLAQKYLDLQVEDDTISEVVEDGVATERAHAQRVEQEARLRDFAGSWEARMYPGATGPSEYLRNLNLGDIMDITKLGGSVDTSGLAAAARLASGFAGGVDTSGLAAAARLASGFAGGVDTSGLAAAAGLASGFAGGVDTSGLAAAAGLASGFAGGVDTSGLAAAAGLASGFAGGVDTSGLAAAAGLASGFAGGVDTSGLAAASDIVRNADTDPQLDGVATPGATDQEPDVRGGVGDQIDGGSVGA